MRRLSEQPDPHPTACLERPQSDATVRLAPKLVIGLIRGELARGLELHFKAAGWRVRSADTTDELREHAAGNGVAAVVLPVDACREESGFLTCAKLIRSFPNVRVVMVGPACEENARFAKFVGATAYVTDTASPDELAKAIGPIR